MVNHTIGELHEQDANNMLGDWLNTVGRGWSSNSERNRAIQNSHERADILVLDVNRMPVVIECEFGTPAVGDATKRLGKTLAFETRPFTEAVAVGFAEECKQDSNDEFRDRLARNEPFLTIQLVYQDAEDGVRVWPQRPLPARPTDLVAFCEYAQVPQREIDKQSSAIAERIRAAGKKLYDSIRLTIQGEETIDRLKSVTGADQELAAAQTACAIWLVAIDLQNDLAQYSSMMRNTGLQTTEYLRKEAISERLTVNELLEHWRIIESVNYLPVIELAIDSLEAGGMGPAIFDILEELDGISYHMNALYAKHIYNFAGELWQRLVPDREERAAHYTKPEIAELLATLAAERFDHLDADSIAQLNMMDAACGTGTLVGAGERALRRKYYAKGGRDPEIHRKRMENHIYAMDVNGIAGTLTAKRLTDLEVGQEYVGSKIAAITHPAGSLTLMDPEATGVAMVLGHQNVTAAPGIGGSTDFGIFHVGLAGINWMLMNPPYSRPRKGRRQASTGLAPFRRAAKKKGYSMSHGQAGLASDFGDLANIRLAAGGIYSTVLPQTAAHAGTWTGWRAELEKDFSDIVVIANTASNELQSMSADTGLSEILVVATKKASRPSAWRPASVLCVNLAAAPTTLAEGYAITQEINAIPRDSQQGFLSCGSYVRTPQGKAGQPWGGVGNSNNELTSVSQALLNAQAWDPLTLQTHRLALPMAALGDLAEIGPTHHLIGHPKGAEPIGAFEWTPLADLPVEPAQKSMWAANAKNHTRIIAQPTHGGSIVDAELAKRMVDRRSRWFLNRDMRWTSQVTALAHTRQDNHGGSSWVALEQASKGVAKALALFNSSIFGGIVRNSYGSTQDAGRARMQIGAIPGLPCPAFHADTEEARRAQEIAERNFDELANLTLEPFAYCFRDDNRKLIDNVVSEMLGLDSNDNGIQELLEHYRWLFASEPNVNGRQKGIVSALAAYRAGQG
jgi:hypothetical protein